MGKTIFINGRFLTQPVTGVQRYSLELLHSMDLILAAESPQPGIRFICLAPPEPFQDPGWTQIKIRRVGINQGNLWEQVDLAIHAQGELLFSPANIGPFYYRNQVVTIHDASIFAVPQAYSRTFRAKYVFVFKQLSQIAQQILTVSGFSRDELARYLKIPLQRFTVTPNGSDHLDAISSDLQILQQHNLEKKAYLFMVASQSTHKNLHNVFEALQWVKTPIKVVVVGSAFQRIFQHKKKQSYPENVQMLGYVNDRQLKALYENALGFIFPSAYEGFGLPVLEAMRCGCPVLSSNTASLPEVAGNAALYFDPHQPQQIAEVLNHFLETPSIHPQLIFQGCERARQFEWSLTAKKTLEVLYRAR